MAKAPSAARLSPQAQRSKTRAKPATERSDRRGAEYEMGTDPRQQNQSPEQSVGATGKSTTDNITDLPADVKALRDLIERRHIPLMDIAEIVQTIYPKCDKTLISKCANGNRYGIQLRKDALTALTTHFRETSQNAQNRPQTGGRKKPKRIYCRLTETSYAALQRLISQSGVTMQTYIETLVMNEIRREAAKLPTSASNSAGFAARSCDAAGGAADTKKAGLQA